MSEPNANSTYLDVIESPTDPDRWFVRSAVPLEWAVLQESHPEWYITPLRRSKSPFPKHDCVEIKGRKQSPGRSEVQAAIRSLHQAITLREEIDHDLTRSKHAAEQLARLIATSIEAREVARKYQAQNLLFATMLWEEVRDDRHVQWRVLDRPSRREFKQLAEARFEIAAVLERALHEGAPERHAQAPKGSVLKPPSEPLVERRTQVPASLQLSFDLWIDPGEATSEEIKALFDALCDLHRAAGGMGLTFSDEVIDANARTEGMG